MDHENPKSRFKRWREGLANLNRLWRERDKLADRNIAVDLKSFLPPALEVVEQPPHPAPRVMLWVILAIFLTAFAWSVFGQLDIISVAEGKIIPSGKVKEIQPYDRGMVKTIFVSEGQLVEVGQPLIELDQAQTRADEASLAAELRLAEPRLARQRVLVDLLQLPRRPADDQVRLHTALGGDMENGWRLLEEYKTITSRLESLESQIEEKTSEFKSNQAIIKKYKNSIPLTAERLDALKRLYDRNIVGMNEYFNVQERHIELTQDLAAAEERSTQLAAAIESAEKQLETIRSESHAKALSDLDELTVKLRQLSRNWSK